MTKAWSSEKTWGITIHIGSTHPPVYQQLIEQIRFHIGSGHLKAGEKLPTVRELAAALEINFNTVAKAYHDLAGQGFILGRKGGGSSVTEQVPVAREDKRKKVEQLYQRILTEAASYGISQDEMLNFIQHRGG